MSRKVLSFLMIALVMFASTSLVMPRAQAQAGGAANGGGLIIPIGSIQGITGTGAFTGAASLVGNFALHSVQVVNGQLQAVGTLTATVLDASGATLGTISVANLTAPLTATGACPILTLHIGQIHLNLLGLDVTLSPIDLNITAQAGNGNLLGNLLCDVANLLNNNGPLSGIANLLNNLLRNL